MAKRINDIENAMKILKDGEESHNLLLNYSKCGLFNSIKGIHRIPNTDKYKYLGIVMSYNGMLDAQLDTVRRTSIAIAARISGTTKIAKSACILYKMLVLSYIRYSMTAVHHSKDSQTNISKLRMISRISARIAMRLGGNTKNKIVERISGIDKAFSKPAPATTLPQPLINNDIIELMNLFNRAVCDDHGKRMSTNHLEGHHNTILAYDDILTYIEKGNSEEIKRTLITLQGLQKKDKRKMNE